MNTSWSLLDPNIVTNHPGVFQQVDVSRESTPCGRNGMTIHKKSSLPYSGLVLGSVVLFRLIGEPGRWILNIRG